jgi:hypothetical protein
MAKLSDLQLASLLEEIAAAMRVDAPIESAMERLRDRRLGAVATSAGQVAESIKHGRAVADSIGDLGGKFQQQAVGAVAASEFNGNPEMLDRFAALLRSRHDFLRSAQLAWLYPLILLVVGYAIVAAVMAPLLRTHQGRVFYWSELLVTLSQWLLTYWMVPPTLFLIAILVTFVWLGGRRSLPRDVRLHIFCRALCDQLECDVPESEAIRNAAAMSGDEALLRESNPTSRSPALASLLGGVSSPLRLMPDATDEQMLLAKLKYLAAIHAQRARSHEYVWSRLIPSIAMVAVGGGITLAFVWWVIAPIYQQVAHW